MDLIPPACAHPDCPVTLVPRTLTGRRGDRTVTYEGHGWRCSRCADPGTGRVPLEFVDARLMSTNETALARAWRVRYREDLPPTARRGRNADDPRTERVAAMLTPEELARVDARRGSRSRSDFLREVITKACPAPRRTRR